MQRRLGWAETYSASDVRSVAWPRFLRYQFHRLGGTSLPFILSPYIDTISVKPTPGSMTDTVTGIGISCVCLVGLMFVRQKILWATLALSGFCWALPMRYSSTFSEHDSVFYVGIPLVFYSLALLGVRRLSDGRLVVGLCVVALLIFVLSSFKMARVGHDAEAAKLQKETMSDFDVIRRLTTGKVVFFSPKKFDGGSLYGTPRYYLAGSVILFPDDRPNFTFADFVVLPERQTSPALLTPDNTRFFLYDRPAYTSHLERSLQETGVVVGRANAEVDTVTIYLSANSLYYVRNPRPEDALPARPAAGGHRNAPFFLHFIPADEDDLPAYRKQYGFDNRDFLFHEYFVTGGERMIAMRNLPAYPITGIRTGQYMGEDRLWEVEVNLDGSRL